MRLKISFFSLLITGMFIAPVVFGQVKAAYFKFDKTTVSANANDTFQLAVVIDAESDQLSSADSYVTYDSSVLEAQSVANGSFFPTVTNNITSGKIYIAGMVDDAATSKTGSGTLATITFKALKSGSATAAFDCQSSKIIKNDINASNVMVCSKNGTSAVSVGGSSSTTATPTPGTYNGSPTPTALPKTGYFDEVPKLAVPGMILLFLGTMVRFLLL